MNGNQAKKKGLLYEETFNIFSRSVKLTVAKDNDKSIDNTGYPEQDC